MNHSYNLIGLQRTVIGFHQLTSLLPFKPVVIFISNSNCPDLTRDNQALFFVMSEEDKQPRTEPLLLGFKGSSCGTLNNENGHFNFKKNNILDDSLSNQLAVYLLQEIRNSGYHDILHLEHMILAFGNYLTKKYNRYNRLLCQEKVYLNHYKMTSIYNFLEDNIDQNITTKDLAEVVDLSVSHFIRIFKKTTSFTPYQYIIKIKMEKAKELLLGSNDSIIKISLHTGFDNPSHFAQVFKAYTGFTPLGFRKKLRLKRYPIPYLETSIAS